MASRSIAAKRPGLRLIVSLLLPLGACAPANQTVMSPGDFAYLQEALRGDPAARQGQTAACIREGAAEPPAQRERIAQAYGTDADAALRLYCEGLTLAIGLEAITYDDFVAVETGQADQATATRLLEAARAHAEPPLGPEGYAELRARLAGDAAFRGEQVRMCVEDLGGLWTPDERAGFAAKLRVDPEDVARAYCGRLHDAMASGRLGYDDWLGLMDMDRHPEAWQRAMRVLRDDPAAEDAAFSPPA